MTQEVRSFEYGSMTVRYLRHLPPGYDDNPSGRWPLILFLHGAGERGSDPELVKQHGIARVVEEKPDFPFITISPQCPAGTWWAFELPMLDALLEHALGAYRADPDRVYCTGLSMGGYGTWNLTAAYPDRFAAIAPICGGGDPDTVCAFKHVPAWAFHGALDNVVLLRESRKMVDALRDCGGRVRFTIYPSAGHDSWTRAYADERLYEWLLGHVRGETVKTEAS